MPSERHVEFNGREDRCAYRSFGCDGHHGYTNGAVTAVGANILPKPKVLGHIGARGTAYWNVRLLDHHSISRDAGYSRRPESRDAFGERLSRDLGKPVTVTDNWESCLRDADIMVEASRMEGPSPELKTEWIKPGSLIIPYGTMSAVEDNILDAINTVVVDHWEQCLVVRLFAAPCRRSSDHP